MRVLVLGSGAREHALVVRLAAEAGISSVCCAPGNPGIARLVRTFHADLQDIDGLVALASREQVDLTVVGPEQPLGNGLADRLAAAGLQVFGPTASAARLETSKAFAKAFMQRHGVPTARFETCTSLEDALRVVRGGTFGIPVVLKADGLAAGKGVVIAQTQAEAEAALVAAMRDRRFGAAGETIVIEECLSGPEVSFFLVCDGTRAVPIGSAQDHKRIFDNDEGPNTGGMGAFAPSPIFPPALQARVMAEVVEPVMKGMAEEGCPFAGFLYVGLMLTAAGPKVIEFNVRMGDPETQVVMPLIDEPLLPLLAAAAAGRLTQSTCRTKADRAVCVVIASRGYPESSEAGQVIDGIADAETLAGVTVCHAGTAMRDGKLVTAGGRVLTVIGRGQDFRQAIDRAYAGVAKIRFDGMQYRRDIGKKALNHQIAGSSN
jgi:phosphoribosylamine--glycine ligase